MLTLDTLTPELGDRYRIIKAYQNERLRATYHDFLADEEWSEVCRFFFGRVYNTDDTQQRDAGIERLHHHVQRVLGGDVVRCLGNIIALQNLTVALDLRLLEDLISLDAPAVFDLETYEDAYRAGDNYAERARQIDILVDTLTLGYRVFHRFGIGFSLKSLHRFQQLRGDAMVTGFLVEAYDIMHALERIEPLAVAVDERERSRLDRIYRTIGAS